MTLKLVINRCYGGFSLSCEAKDMYLERTAKKDNPSDPGRRISSYDVSRDDPDLIAVIETLGSQAASGQYSKLKVIEIPLGVEWVVQEYDGIEWIAEKHRTWSGEEDIDKYL